MNTIWELQLRQMTHVETVSWEPCKMYASKYKTMQKGISS